MILKELLEIQKNSIWTALQCAIARQSFFAQLEYSTEKTLVSAISLTDAFFKLSKIHSVCDSYIIDF